MFAKESNVGMDGLGGVPHPWGVPQMGATNEGSGVGAGTAISPFDTQAGMKDAVEPIPAGTPLGAVHKKGRTSTAKGGTAREHPEYIKVNYSAEFWDPAFMAKLMLCLTRCTWVDKKRSYLYIRENSVESNQAYAPCCGMLKTQDDITVQYFDKPQKYFVPAPGPARTTERDGGTQTLEGDKIRILYDAEILPADCMTRLKLLAKGCSTYDVERSYLYVRENSIETNIAYGMCCGYCGVQDSVTVNYFDRVPYKPGCDPLWCCCCCVPMTSPKLDVMEFGFACCCMECPHAGCFNYCGLCWCCSGFFQQRKVVLMPFEKYCCGCVPNRTSKTCWCWNGNCWRCYGKLDGNPLVYDEFEPQPTNPYEFSEYAQYAMSQDATRQGTLVGMAQ
jgi:hypothetical protein